jgi:hypothetical protein
MKLRIPNEADVEAFMASLESVIVSVVGRVACWLSPVPSAVLVGRAASNVFDLSGWLAVIVAVVVEMVGMVASNLWLTAKEWNDTKRKSDPAANEKLALGLMFVYFATTVALLLAFEVPAVLETGDLVGLTALLFPGLSAVGVIALNERVVHGRRVASAKADKKERAEKAGKARRSKESAIKRPLSVQAVNIEPVSDRRARFFDDAKMGAIDLSDESGITGKSIAEIYGVGEATGRRWKRKWKENGGDAVKVEAPEVLE